MSPRRRGGANPDVLTFLRMVGQGKVEVVLNGETVATLRLEGEATISDLALEAGGNHFLIRWQIPTPATTRSRFWDDIEKRQETSLAFR